MRLNSFVPKIQFFSLKFKWVQYTILEEKNDSTPFDRAPKINLDESQHRSEQSI